MSKQLKKEIQDKLKQIPIGAHIVIFGKNPATKFWGWLETHRKDIPTHSAIWVDTWKGKENVVLEAVKWVEFNGLEKYLKKKKTKIVAQWYTNLTMEESMELHKRIIWFANRKFFYDLSGYANFITRLLPFLRRIIKPSNKLFFCSELVATNYEGDKNSKYKTIKLWEKIRNYSVKPTPTNTAPIDGYSYMFKNKYCKTMIIKEKGEKAYK